MTTEWLLQILMLIIGIIGGGAVFYFLSQNRGKAALLLGIVAGIFLIIASALYYYSENLKKKAQASRPVYFGNLIPGNEPEPPLPPGTPNNTISLLLGDDLRILAAQSNNFVFSKQGMQFLSIGIRNNVMYINASIMNSKNQVIVRIIENEFQVNPEYAFNPKQPDEHSLIVRDSQGLECLNIKFMNQRAMRIVGRFYMSGSSEPVLILPNDGIRWPGGGGIAHLTIDMTASKGGVIQF